MCWKDGTWAKNLYDFGVNPDKYVFHSSHAEIFTLISQPLESWWEKWDILGTDLYDGVKFGADPNTDLHLVDLNVVSHFLGGMVYIWF